jgi:hypothetical protein
LSLCLLAVGVTVGGLWFALGSGDATEPPSFVDGFDGTLDPETGDPLEDRSTGDITNDDSSDPESADSPDGAADEDIERRSLAAAQASPEPSPAVLRIRVWDPTTRREVAGAEVFCLQLENRRHRARLGDLPAIRGSWPGGRHLVDAVIAAGRRFVTDERGEVEVVGPLWQLAVAARTADKIGFAEAVRDKPGPLQVALLPEDGVDFAVVGVDGAPREGVRVSLYGVENARSGAVHWEGVTDGYGRARLRHLSLILGRARDQRLLAFARTAAAVPVMAEFRAEPLPKEPIELRLPAAGRATVEICDSLGEPLISAFEVYVRPPKETLNGAALAGLPDLARNLATGVSATKAFDQRFVELYPIAAGAVADIVASASGWRRRMTTAAMRVTTSPVDGEVSTVRVVTPPTWIVLRGTATDGEGNAFPAGSLRAVLHSVTQQTEIPSIPIAADGRFEVLVDIGMRILDNARLELSAPEATGDDGRPQALVPLGRLQPDDHRQLGAVALTPMAPTTVGFVRDDLGRAVEGAQVVVLQTVAGRARPLPLTPTVSATDGRYAIFGAMPANPLTIRVSRRGHLADSQEFVSLPPTHDVVLTRTANLRLTVRVPADSPPLALEARLVATDGQAIDLRFDARGDRHTWTSDAIRRGVYELSIGIRNVPGELHRERGIVADPDRAAPTLEIDLRDRMYAFHVIATSPDGTHDRAAFGHALVRMTELDGRLGWRAFPMRRGEIRFVAFQPSLECALFVTGRAETSGWLRAGENRLVSRAIQPIRVSVPGLRAVVGDAAIRISLVFDGDTGFPESIRSIDQASGDTNSLPRASLGKSGGGVLGADEAAMVLVSRPGRYAVVARFDRPRKPRVSVEIGHFDGVIDGLTPQEVRIPFDAEKVRAALAE